MSESVIKWRDGLTFDVELQGHNLVIDASPEVGGRNLGTTPKPLMLSALGGCTGMDVVSILKKMKIINYELEVHVEADGTSEHPKVYSAFRIEYRFEGKELPV
ncbi:MAG: OsmC family protein, partial [Candidatus Cloacimonetes bacterium]|nr:OsmC family protein [Candidatus Cloacimonadota bacterium]